LDTENIFTVELRKILKYKEELLTDVKNMLYRRTDDVEILKNSSPTAFGKSRRCARRRGGGRKNWRFSGKPPRRSWIWWIQQKRAKQTSSPYWNDFVGRRKESSSSSRKPRSHASAMPLHL
jgi:hypothetical protein